MSILIKGMDMPKECWECYFQDCGDCILNRHKVVDKCILDGCRDEDCPLVPVPTPHGDLIERNAAVDALDLTDWYHQNKNKDMVHGANSAEHQAWYKEQDAFAAIAAAPTIIEAEGEDE